MMKSVSMFALAVGFVACGGKEEPATPEGEMVDIAWELMKPLDSSHECKKIGDALEPWLKDRAPRFEELVAKVDKLVGADANNLDRVEIRLKTIATRCVNPTGPKMALNEHDDRVEKVVKMFPKMQMGFELR